MEKLEMKIRDLAVNPPRGRDTSANETGLGLMIGGTITNQDSKKIRAVREPVGVQNC
jgi:hypothetical protein